MAPSRATLTFLARTLTRTRTLTRPRTAPPCRASRTALSNYCRPASTFAASPSSVPSRWPRRTFAIATPATTPPSSADRAHDSKPPATAAATATDADADVDGSGPEPPDHLSAGERAVFDKVMRELRPRALAVQDVSGGCGSMYAIEIESSRFAGLSVVRQHRLVNEVLREEIAGWHGVQLKTRAA